MDGDNEKYQYLYCVKKLFTCIYQYKTGNEM